MVAQEKADTVAEYTTIRIKPDTADELHDRKKRGDSYDDVIQRLLTEPDADTDKGGSEA